MARLIQPREQVTPLQAGISTAQAATTGRGIADLGRTIEKAGEEYFQAARAASNNAVLSRAVSKATQAFSLKSQERFSQRTDRDGNPTFESLPKDIGSIGNEVLNETASTLFDINVQNSFRQQFGNYVNNQQLKSLGQARQQQLDFANSSLTENLSTLRNQAISDDASNVNQYIAQADTAIDQALASGVITPQDRDKFKGDFNTETRTELFRQLIDANPKGAIDALGSAETGLNAKQVRRLKDEAKAALEDENRAMDSQEREQEKLAKEQVAVVKAGLSAGIAEGTVGLKEIEQQRETLGEVEYFKLREKFAKRAKAKTAKEDVNLQISTALAEGKPLLPFSSQQIASHYNEAVQLQANEETGELPSISQKASIASRYKGEVKPFQKELQRALLFGDEDEAAQAVQAISFLNDNSPESIQRLDNDSVAIAAVVDSFVNNTNISFGEALKVAKEQVVDVEDPIRQERARKFRDIKRFNVSDIKSLVRDIVPTGFLGFGRADIAPGVGNQIRGLIKEAYIATGDEEGAIKYVTTKTREALGESDFNGGTIMFSPPERIFPQFTSESLKANLSKQISPFLPEGVKSKEVNIQTDALTRGTNIQGEELISYSLFTIGDNGEQIPLQDKDTGAFLRWEVDPGEVQQQRKLTAVEKAKQVREFTLSQRERFGQGNL